MSFWKKLFGKKEEEGSVMESSTDTPVSAPTPPPVMETTAEESDMAAEPMSEAPNVETEDDSAGKTW